MAAFYIGYFYHARPCSEDSFVSKFKVETKSYLSLGKGRKASFLPPVSSSHGGEWEDSAGVIVACCLQSRGEGRQLKLANRTVT